MDFPKEINVIINKLAGAGFIAYAVGGCVRDFLLGQKPDDWDITASALPEDIQKVFPKNFYENSFGTVTILTGAKDKDLAEVEITPFRKEGKYTDKRHPDEIVWAKSLEEDLARRDFTINALATADGKTIIDLFGGQNDLKDRLIRTVGNSDERFSEDALRLMRAIRLATKLNFRIETGTMAAIKKNANLLNFIAEERVGEEFSKIIMSEEAANGILLLRESGLLKEFLPELEDGWGVMQNKHHEYTVFEHLIRSLDFTAKSNYDLEVRLAALFHDVAKPKTKMGDGPDCHFYGHDIASAGMAIEILERLRFSRMTIGRVVKLIRAHMFIYNTNPAYGAVTTDAAVRRIIRRVGQENIWDLIKLRLADRAGSGVKKIEKFDNRHFKFRVENLLREPISVKMLAINGGVIMKELEIEPGPKIGWLLNALLQEVLDDSSKNNKEYLIKRLNELNKLTDEDLQVLADESKREVGIYEDQAEGVIKEKYWVNVDKNRL